MPFASQHSLRAMLNPPALLRANDGAGPDLSSVDLPVLCATTKLWFLELEQPPFTWAAYDELRNGWSARVGITKGGGGGEEKIPNAVDASIESESGADLPTGTSIFLSTFTRGHATESSVDSCRVDVCTAGERALGEILARCNQFPL